MFSEREILEIAVRMEKNGENEYRKAVEEVSGRVLIASLEWMAAEEREHADFFSGLLDGLEARTKSTFGEEMDASFLKDLIGGSSLSLKTVDFAQVASLEELLTIFIGFEEDSILFYQMITPMIDDDETRAQVERIVAEEQTHIKRLKELAQA
ncbi:MAG: ferritin family protein [Desulfobacterales bacterium]|nr:ferritin family protein [Desulfobacterales bacterium]